MSTTEAVRFLIAAAFALASLGVAIPGWLLNRPEDSNTLRLRLVAFILLVFTATVYPVIHHGWWWRVWQFVFILWTFTRCTHWYKRMDAARKREQATSPTLTAEARARLLDGVLSQPMTYHRPHGAWDHFHPAGQCTEKTGR